MIGAGHGLSRLEVRDVESEDGAGRGAGRARHSFGCSVTAAVALFGVALGVMILMGDVPPLPRTALGLTVVLVSLLLASAQSYPPSLGALDTRAPVRAPCGATCGSPGMNPVVNGGTFLPGRDHVRPAVPGAVADPLVPGAPVRAQWH